MENLYAQALWKSIEKGRDPKETVSALANILEIGGRSELMPRIRRAFLRLVASESNSQPRVYVAHASDGEKAFKESGISEADVIVDETLIGGWRLETAETLIDNSFKKHLLSIYSNVTNV